MPEIKSVKTIVEAYMADVETANTALAGSKTIAFNDSVTTLPVNINSTEAESSAKQATDSLSSHIAKDRGRIIKMAELFEEKDRELAGESVK